jgi:hypothetical protein
MATTPGRHEANLTAMVVALGDRLICANFAPPAARRSARGADGQRTLQYVHHGAVARALQPAVYVSPQTHASIHKNARTLSLASLAWYDRPASRMASPPSSAVVADRTAGTVHGRGDSRRHRVSIIDPLAALAICSSGPVAPCRCAMGRSSGVLRH